MNQKALVVSFGVLMSVNSFTAEAALSSSALLAFDDGAKICDFTCNMSGSYFWVDTNGDGLQDVGAESTAMSAGVDGGLLVGQTQMLSPNAVPLDGTEATPFDSTWMFFGTLGTYQSTSPVNILSDDGSGNVELDFSGWGAIWSHTIIGLEGDIVNFASETGRAIVTCGVNCANGDSFSLDYVVHVDATHPTFGGVYWGLHLEGVVVSAVPVPAAVWLFGSGLLALAGLARRGRIA